MSSSFPGVIRRKSKVIKRVTWRRHGVDILWVGREVDASSAERKRRQNGGYYLYDIMAWSLPWSYIRFHKPTPCIRINTTRCKKIRVSKYAGGLWSISLYRINGVRSNVATYALNHPTVHTGTSTLGKLHKYRRGHRSIYFVDGQVRTYTF